MIFPLHVRILTEEYEAYATIPPNCLIVRSDHGEYSFEELSRHDQAVRC